MRVLCRCSATHLRLSGLPASFLTYCSRADCSPTVYRGLCEGTGPLYAWTEYHAGLGGDQIPRARSLIAGNATPSRNDVEHCIEPNTDGWQYLISGVSRVLLFPPSRDFADEGPDARSTQQWGGHLRDRTAQSPFPPSKARPHSEWVDRGLNTEKIR
jgi:hypothetical protein